MELLQRNGQTVAFRVFRTFVTLCLHDKKVPLDGVLVAGDLERIAGDRKRVAGDVECTLKVRRKEYPQVAERGDGCGQ